jgi:hypothetical protein
MLVTLYPAFPQFFPIYSPYSPISSHILHFLTYFPTLHKFPFCFYFFLIFHILKGFVKCFYYPSSYQESGEIFPENWKEWQSDPVCRKRFARFKCADFPPVFQSCQTEQGSETYCIQIALSLYGKKTIQNKETITHIF